MLPHKVSSGDIETCLNLLEIVGETAKAVIEVNRHLVRTTKRDLRISSAKRTSMALEKKERKDK